MKIETHVTPNHVFAHRSRNLQETINVRAASDIHFALLVRTLNVLIAERDPAQALARLLTAITKDLEAHSSALWIYNSAWEVISLYEAANGCEVVNGPGHSSPLPNARAGPFKPEGMAHVMAEGPLVIRDVPASRLVEPKRRKWLAANRIRSLFCIPLPACGGLNGVLTIRASKSDAFDCGEEVLGNLLSLLTGLAVQSMKLSRHAEESAVLNERERFAEEIHDGLAQNLAAIVTRLELAMAAFSGNPEEAFQHIRHAQGLAREGVTDARRTVWAMAPLALAGRNLPGALERFSSRVSDGAGFDVTFATHGAPRQLSQKTEINLFRIAQEAINNALRHGHATRIQIKLDYAPESVTLTVEDNGSGFEFERSPGKHGFGLFSLRDRTLKSGGILTVSSSLGEGTRIVVEVPSTLKRCGEHVGK